MAIRKVRVGDIIRLQRTRITPKFDVNYRPIGVYSWGKGIIENEPISGADLSKVSYYRFPGDALILSNIQAWEAAIAVSDGRHTEFISSQRFLPYVPVAKGGVDVRYLLHFFLSDPGMALIRSASPGTVTRNRTLGIKAFEDLVVPLPDLDVQRAIAYRLDRLSHTFHNANTRSSANIMRVTALRQKIMSVTNEAPTTSAAELFELKRRNVRVAADAEYREIGIRSFGRGIFHKPSTSGADIGSKRVFYVKPGDLMISNVFAWEGAVAHADTTESGMIGSHRFMTWVPRSTKDSSKYFSYYLASPSGVSQLAQASPGSAGRNRTLSITAFQELKLPRPSASQQDEIVARMQLLDKLSTLGRERQKLAIALPQAARNEVFSKLL